MAECPVSIRRIVKKINARIGTGASVQTTGEGSPFCYFVEDRPENYDGWGLKGGRYLWAYVR